MALHYGRDAFIAMGVDSYAMGQPEAWLLLYHMLRVANCEWLWECDGCIGPNAADANHCPDGNMSGDTSNWLQQGGATITKDTTVKFTGAQSLKIVSAGVAGGVRSAALLSMLDPASRSYNSSDSISGPVLGRMTTHDNTGYDKAYMGGRVICSGWSSPGNNGTFPYVSQGWTVDAVYYNPAGTTAIGPTLSPFTTIEAQAKYEIAIWALNDSGESWDVQVDCGDGSPTSVGSITSDGIWTLYHFSFYRTSTGSSYIYVLSASGGKTLHINGINVFRSLYEYFNGNEYGTGGTFTNPDLFLPGGKTPTVDDTGKWLFIWDTGVPNNSGYYKILGVSGGSYQLNLRSGSMTFNPTGSSVARWRIVDAAGHALNTPWLISCADNWLFGPGFGVQSPHSSKWRYFQRVSPQSGGYSSRRRTAVIWASPEDTDFDVSSGTFFNTGPSTQRSRTGPYLWEGDNQHYVCGGGRYTSLDRSSRFFFMTDDDVSFFTTYQWGIARVYDAACFIGYTGSNVDFPGIEEFAVLFGNDTMNNSVVEEVQFDGSAGAFLANATMFSPQAEAVKAVAGVLGYGASTLAPMTQSNACPNPWSSEEHIDPLLLIRDPALRYNCPAEKDLTVGLYMGRANLVTLATFDSGNYLHFQNGLVWRWNGATLV